MRQTPPLCAQAMAVSAGVPLNTRGASASEETDAEEEEVLAEAVLVGDGDLLRGKGGRPPFRRSKKSAARSEVSTSRRGFAKSAFHCAAVFACHGITEPKSGSVFCALPGADTPRSRPRMRDSSSSSKSSRSSGADMPRASSGRLCWNDVREPEGALRAR